MKEIPLTQGKVALVDDEDFEFLLNFGSWSAHFNRNWYATCGYPQLLMHRVITERINPGFKGEIDHVDGNGLNNQRYNLRIATRSQNAMNRGAPENNTSGYKGVHFHRPLQKWCATICYQGTRSNLGLFDSKIKAAKAYNRAARRLFGEFARFNPV